MLSIDNMSKESSRIKLRRKCGISSCGHHVFPDDPHENCMQCRGKSHTCPLCETMGSRSRTAWDAWIANKPPPPPEKVATDRHMQVDGSAAPAGGDPVAISGTGSVSGSTTQIPNNMHSLADSGAGSVSGRQDQSPNGHTSLEETSRDPMQGAFVSKSEFSAFAARMEAMFLRVCGQPNVSSTPPAPHVPMVHRTQDTSSSDVLEVSDPNSADIFANEGSQLSGDDHDSVLSSWDYKRRKSLDDQADGSGVSFDDRNQGDLDNNNNNSTPDPKAQERFISAVTRVITDMGVTGAETTTASKGALLSTRVQGKKATAKLPFKEEHLDVVKKVWNRDPFGLGTFSSEIKKRYSIIAESDFEKYLKHARLDSHLACELFRSGHKLDPKNPKLPNKHLASFEPKVKIIAQQAQMGVACAVVQSWLIEHAVSQVGKLQELLKSSVSPDDFEAIEGQVSLHGISESLVMAQDAALDTLDLQLREAAIATGMRRNMWLQQTSWSEGLQEEAKRYPITGDGNLCGPRLKERLESLKGTQKEVIAAEVVSAAHQGSNSKKRSFTSTKGGPPPKLAKSEKHRPPQQTEIFKNPNSSHFRGGAGSQRRGRGQNRGGASGSYRFPSSSAQGGKRSG